jgi:hypothetical protein
LPRFPSENTQIDPAPSIEFHTLALQPQALRDVGPAGPGQTDPALCAYDPVPGNVTILRQGVQSVANLPGIPPKAGELCHLTVGGDTPLGDAPDDGVYAFPSV